MGEPGVYGFMGESGAYGCMGVWVIQGSMGGWVSQGCMDELRVWMSHKVRVIRATKREGGMSVLYG